MQGVKVNQRTVTQWKLLRVKLTILSLIEAFRLTPLPREQARVHVVAGVPVLGEEEFAIAQAAPLLLPMAKCLGHAGGGGARDAQHDAPGAHRARKLLDGLL